VWSKLKHDHILPLIGLYTRKTLTYMISPWMDNGDALTYVNKGLNVDCLKLLIQVAKGLRYLHTFNPVVVHGDLRGPNILISNTGDAYIADFGLSHMEGQPNRFSYSTPFFMAGNPRWQAPEQLDNEADHKVQRTTATDIFSFGRVILELTSGEVPFGRAISTRQVMIKVMKGEGPPRPTGEIGKTAIARGLDDSVWSLAQDCWRSDSTTRPSTSEIILRLTSVQEARSRALQ